MHCLVHLGAAVMPIPKGVKTHERNIYGLETLWRRNNATVIRWFIVLTVHMYSITTVIAHILLRRWSLWVTSVHVRFDYNSLYFSISYVFQIHMRVCTQTTHCPSLIYNHGMIISQDILANTIIYVFLFRFKKQKYSTSPLELYIFSRSTFKIIFVTIILYPSFNFLHRLQFIKGFKNFRLFLKC